MKRTLLDMVQGILSSMDSDEVNSISDTVESLQVANIIKDTYYDLVSQTKLNERKEIFQLDASGDNNKPTIMYVPSTVKNILWVKYNKKDTSEGDTTNYHTITYLPLESFLSYVYARDETQSDVDEMTDGDITYLIKNDVNPVYYTTIDETTLVFDAYDSTEDTTLQKSKTLCYGEVFKTFELDDTFIPDIDADLFALLYNEAKSQAFYDLKQSANEKTEQRARRQWIHSTYNKDKVKENEYYRLPNYGRK